MLNRTYYVRLRDGLGCPVLVSDEAWKGDLSVDGPEAVTGDRIRMAAERKLHLPCTIAETERLLIRELTESDAERFPEMDEQELGSAFTASGIQLLKDREYLASYTAWQYPVYGYGIFGVFLRETGAFAGLAGFSVSRTEEPELGYYIVPAFRARGLLAEAAAALLDYAAREQCFETLLVRVRKDNAAGLGAARCILRNSKTGIRIELRVV